MTIYKNTAFILELLFLLFPLQSVANVVGNDTQNFNPITSGIDFVTAQSSHTLEPGLANFGFFLNTARNVLPNTVDAAGNTVTSQDILSFADLNFGYGLLDNVDLGLNVSYLLRQDTSRDESGAQFSKSGLNEIRANTKISLLDRKPVGLAIILSANLNQVKNNPFLGKSPGPTTNIELAADTQYAGNVFALNFGYRRRTPGVAVDNAVYSPLGSQLIASLGFSHYFERYDFKLISEIFGASLITPTREQSASFASEFLLGGKFEYDRSTSLQAGFSQKLSDGLFAPEVRIYAGLNINMELIPRKIVTALNSEGREAVEMGIYSGYQPQDIAKLTSVPFDEITKTHEFSLRHSAPENIQGAEKPPFEVFRLDGFDFAFGSSVIQEQHKPLLKKLLLYLNAPPHVIKARIEGHTDSLGTESQNKMRSASRAEAVKKFLQDNGLNNDITVEAIGYGSQKPIADNSNFQERQKNRRVEVRILREIKSPEKKFIREEKVFSK